MPDTGKAYLIADMLGSVRLFGSVSQSEALQIEARYSACLQAAISACGGVVQSAIGDEVLGVFDQSDAAWQAACQIHREIGALASQSKVRLPCRQGLYRQADDEPVEFAERCVAWIAANARGGQILASRRFLESLQSPVQNTPASLIVPSAPALSVLAVDVVLLLNSVALSATDPKALTQPLPLAPRHFGAIAHLTFDQAHHFLDSVEGGELRLGRDPSADIVIADRRVSRQHGRVVVRAGSVFYIDASTNGSFVSQGASERFVRHEEVVLRQSGKICFGGSANDPASPCVSFEIL